ncbi:MAG: GNAT family N-acetyltransferase [Polyangiales bacterium]
MARYHVRTITRDDFSTLMGLENKLFGADHGGVLGPYYVRLCCEFFPETCLVVEVDGNAVGYVLSFVRDREAYCTTLAMLPEFQGSRATHALLRGFVAAIAERVDTCWFTVEETNKAARALHAMLGAKEVEVRADFYGPGAARIVSRIERDAFERLRGRFERIGLVGSTQKRSSEVTELTPPREETPAHVAQVA